ncbi:transcriptional repressor LexA [Euzebya tangerina]|uniref:transcriptional repressor LexA n=1 Tax=Euzebya tangerina TaxID=591198 RepID=UPI000E30FB28|nr:transcriptional repressor LexA [Euzebya tangerina]
MAKPLSLRQQRILYMIQSTVAERGYPPSVREIGDAVGLRSPSSVHSQMKTLEDLGYIRRDPSRPRAIEVLAEFDEDAPDTSPTRTVPVVGEIAAGGPILADQQIDEHLVLPESFVGSGTIFALTVRGESMIDAGVMPGDTVVVRQQPTVEQGEMCAALIEDEATVKFFRRTKAGEVWLDPANESYDPIPVPPDAQGAIMGKVVAVLRKL